MNSICMSAKFGFSHISGGEGGICSDLLSYI